MLENLAQGAGSKLDPVLLASEARKELGLEADEPILDICSLLEQAGVKLFPYNYASDEFFGLSVGPKDNGPAIIVNTWERISTERKIFSAAHELGHLLMHISGYSIDNISEDRQQEAEADLFTGYFLMPKKGFDKEWDAAAGLHFLDRVMKVKYIFKVSYKTVLYRLIHLGVADKTIWKKFNLAFEQYYGKRLSHKEELFSEGAEPYGIHICALTFTKSA